MKIIAVIAIAFVVNGCAPEYMQRQSECCCSEPSYHFSQQVPIQSEAATLRQV